jgi:hypothetical protein
MEPFSRFLWSVVGIVAVYAAVTYFLAIVLVGSIR